jgi:predicted dehydrogenase
MLTRTAPIGVGVIGLGFMGQRHVRAYAAAAGAGHPCELVAVCDGSEARLTGRPDAAGNLDQKGARAERLFDPARVRAYTGVDELLADKRVGLVSVCTYTDTHVELALRALAAGKHVLVEKPVALRSAEVRRLAEGARKSGKLCMPAMCMRFWPGWDWLAERVRDGSLGAVRSATFQRLGSEPSWAPFYADYARSGGALMDLHIHDADFIHWCFGRPAAVSCSGTARHMTTGYRFEDGPPHVSAEGAWDLAPGAGFRMRYLVAFERATAEFDLAREPALVVHTAEGSTPVALPALSGYDGEVRHLMDAIAAGGGPLRATLDDAVAVTEMLEAERLSMDRGASVRL